MHPTRDGKLMATSFPVRHSEPDKYLSSLAFGKHDHVLNPPDRDRTSTVRADYNNTSRTVQSAGGTKMPVPYKPGAPRNRLPVEFHRDPKPFSSTLKFDAGLINQDLHKYRTISGVTQKEAAVPMQQRRGFTNDGIRCDINTRLKAKVLG